MAATQEMEGALTQLETALRATVSVIGASISDLAARVGTVPDVSPWVARLNEATLILTQLAEAVQSQAAGQAAPSRAEEHARSE